MENNSKKVRNIVKRYYNILNDLSDFLGYDVDKNLAFISMGFTMTRLKGNPYVDILRNMIYMIGFDDLYRLLKVKEYQNDLSYIEENYFNAMKMINSKDELEEFFSKNSPILPLAMNSMVYFLNMSAFNKIISYKVLTDEENEKLQKINTLHDFDVKKYDIDIDANLLLNQIKKGTKNYAKEDLISEAANFVQLLTMFDMKSRNNVISELIEKDKLAISHYMSPEKVNDKNENEEDIKKRIEFYRYMDKVPNLYTKQIKILIDSALDFEENIKPLYELDEENNLVKKKS